MAYLTTDNLVTFNSNLKTYIANRDGDISLLTNNNIADGINDVYISNNLVQADLTSIGNDITNLEQTNATNFIVSLAQSNNTYVLSQDGVAKANILVPADKKLVSGEVIDDILVLTLNDNTSLNLDMSSFGDFSLSEGTITFTNTNDVLTAQVTNGSIENNNIKNSNITEEKLSLSLQEKLTKGEAAISDLTANNYNQVMTELRDLHASYSLSTNTLNDILIDTYVPSETYYEITDNVFALRSENDITVVSEVPSGKETSQDLINPLLLDISSRTQCVSLTDTITNETHYFKVDYSELSTLGTAVWKEIDRTNDRFSVADELFGVSVPLATSLNDGLMDNEDVVKLIQFENDVQNFYGNCVASLNTLDEF